MQKTSVVKINKVKGIRPDFDVYIGRRLNYPNANFEGSKWYNPYSVKKFGLEKTLWFYERHIRLQIKRNPEYYNLEELKGKRLGCWCITTDKLEPFVCHGQVLMKIIKEFENAKMSNA